MPLETIINYTPKTSQEEVDKRAMIEFINNNKNSLSRDNLIAHFTTSAIIVNETLEKVLFAYHNIYQNYTWIGGHNDLDNNFINVCKKEIKEETGLENFSLYSNEPIMLDIINVNNHLKNGEYINDHLHLNITYLVIAAENEKLSINPSENSDLKWFDLEDIVHVTKEERMKPIFEKAYNIIKKIKNKTP